MRFWCTQIDVPEMWDKLAFLTRATPKACLLAAGHACGCGMAIYATRYLSARSSLSHIAAPRCRAGTQDRIMTVGFLYGPGAETLIFVTGTSGKISENFRLPAEKPKSAVDTRKTKKKRRLGIRCWDPNLSGGYQNCGLGIHCWENFQNISGRNSEIFSKV